MDKKDSLSIETQIELCRNSINSNPNEFPIEVYDDKGYSGKNMIRPEFQEHKVEFCSVNETFDTSTPYKKNIST